MPSLSIIIQDNPKRDDVIIITKARNVRWVGQVTRIGEKGNAYRFFGGNAIKLLRRLKLN
jgi:hypothetical protein